MSECFVSGLSLEQELKRAEEELDFLKVKLKNSHQRVGDLEEAFKDLQRCQFNEEDCWIWNGEDVAANYIDSLVCPVVISPHDLKDILKKAGML